MRAAIQGVPGAFSHEAARRMLGNDVEVLGCRTFEDMFASVGAGEADRAVVPVENTLAGTVQRPMDLLVAHELTAIRETRVPIRLCLIMKPGESPAGVSAAASHPVALEQCRGFFRRHPDVRSVSWYDTAGSVKDLLEGDVPFDAAIGSELSAAIYGGEVIERSLEDDRHNYTRFLLLSSHADAPPKEGVKTSVTLTLPHAPGALHRALASFAERGVDLTRVESRPIPGRPWEYRFFVDLAGVPLSVQDEAIEGARRVTADLRVLGQYPEEPREF